MKDVPGNPLKALFRGLLIIIVALPCLLVTLLFVNRIGRSIPLGEKQLDEAMLNWWTSLTCRIFGVRVEASGNIHSPPVLIAANHVSWLDIIAMHSAAAMGFVSKAEVGRWPLIGFLARVSGTVFHERGSHDSASSVVGAMVESLNAGRRVAVFPEGGVRPGYHVKVFHARLFKAAVEAGCPIQPVMIRYVRDGKPDPDFMFYPGEPFLHNLLRLLGRPSCICQLRFLEPFSTEGRPRKELANAARIPIERAFGEPV